MSNCFILNYHTIVPHWGFDVACRTLDVQFRILTSCFDVVPLEKICDLANHGRSPRRTTVAVTFDDGYLDAFVYAIPLCKKHRIPVTVFPIASRIIDDGRIRPSLEDYWQGRVAYRDLYKTVPMSQSSLEFLETGRSDSFMSAAELRKAAEVAEIGSHASVHAQAFFEDRISDFYDGTNGTSSNIYAYEEKPLRGFPLFPDHSNLAARRGFLRPEVKEYVRALGDSYFRARDWKMALRADLMNRFPQLLLFETEEERIRRVEGEVTSSKKRVETMIGRKLRYFAYPYGHHDPVLERVIADNFDAAFTTDIDIIRKDHKPHLLPRAKVHRDIASFISRIVKFSRRK